tara:strand:- start:1692 stop:1985 length:294 start_codon:yes stop_codon:yes gene_type:complete
MISRFIEIYESTRSHSNDMSRSFALREVLINSEHVVCVRPDPTFGNLLVEGKLPEGLDKRQKFSRIYLNRGQVGLDIVVVGDATIIEKKLNKEILKG